MHQLAYLRRERRAAGLSLEELAGLVGCRDVTQLSRVERGQREPSLSILIACRVLFDVQPEALFPKLYENTEARVARHVYALHEKLAHAKGAVAAAKRAFLAKVLHRAAKRS